ncbi:MAG: L,D-transpeptidase family protein [Hyphomicrobiales bacterium]|nr:L,D-transpeptidase family protein [Hyphomicrobiales bacterium]
MVVDRLVRIAAGAAALSLISGAAVAMPDKDGPGTSVVAVPSTGYTHTDRLIDAPTPALSAVLANAVADGLIDKADAEAVVAFYVERRFEPAWIDDGEYTEQARAVIDRIKRADEDGLDPSDYRLPRESLHRHRPPGNDVVARADLILSQAIVDYARHAYSGRIENPTKISSNFGYQPTRLAAGDVLGLVSAATVPAETLAAYHPPQREYQALRAELAAARTRTAEERKPEIPAGPLIKPGMSDPRVPMIRNRLNLASVVEDQEFYGDDVVAAIKAFQKASRLRADGIVGKRTLAAFNQGPRDYVAMIVANMERWRWMPRYLGDFYVRVNVPDYHLSIYKDDDVVHKTRVIVGKSRNQTPLFSDEIEHVVVNPAWNVPASIARNEMLPRLRAGSGLRGYKVYRNIRGRFRAVNPRTVNWRRVNMSRIRIKQPPGSRNALGQVKFLFPNKYSVYLHDTPSRGLFERDSRALSHGCVRVHEPWDFADALLAHSPEVETARLRKMVGGGERWVNLEKKIPVHVTYFTAWVDDSGELQVRDDIYGHDQRVAKALGLS